jgi:hypothetical protein
MSISNRNYIEYNSKGIELRIKNDVNKIMDLLEIIKNVIGTLLIEKIYKILNIAFSEMTFQVND